jgi:hypothetical protein
MTRNNWPKNSQHGGAEGDEMTSLQQSEGIVGKTTKFFKRKLGPLPIWIWSIIAIVIVVVIVVVLVMAGAIAIPKFTSSATEGYNSTKGRMLKYPPHVMAEKYMPGGPLDSDIRVPAGGRGDEKIPNMLRS